VYWIAEQNHIISQIPEQAQETAILCCRIISGMSIIDPSEPAVAAIWYFSLD
jgi:hypothetical protein